MCIIWSEFDPFQTMVVWQLRLQNEDCEMWMWVMLDLSIFWLNFKFHRKFNQNLVAHTPYILTRKFCTIKLKSSPSFLTCLPEFIHFSSIMSLFFVEIYFILLQIKVYRYFKIGRKFYSWLVLSKDINNIIQGQLSCGLYQAITQSYLQLLARYSHVTNTRLIHLSKIICSQALFLSNLNFNV